MRPGQRDAAHDITPADAARLVDAGEAVLLDVREDDEWAAGHATAATHVPLGRLRADSVPAGSTVVAVCRSGARSDQAAVALRGTGFDARNLTGGMNAWKQAGLPVLRDDGRPGEVI
ncbi:MAG: rhodanese-like domain-containing protein [Pseudonocardiales bacterium]|nr:MAG: rhodanese-like domain-containing protein [Pseudonocardiales bacterium]